MALSATRQEDNPWDLLWPAQCYSLVLGHDKFSRRAPRQGRGSKDVANVRAHLKMKSTSQSLSSPERGLLLYPKRHIFKPSLLVLELSHHPTRTSQPQYSPPLGLHPHKMDFLDKLKHEVDGRGQTHPTAQSTTVAQEHEAGHEPGKHEAEPERDFLSKLIAGSGQHRASADDDKKPEKLSFLDRLTHKEEREKKGVELERREAELKVELEKVAQEKKKNEGLFERIREHFDGSEEEKAEATKQEVHHESAASSFFGKLTGKEEREKKAAELDQKEVELRSELEKVEHEKRENEGLLQRLKDHLDGEAGEGGKAEASDKPSFLDKITGKAAEEERLRREEENKTTLEKMKDRLNEQMGGGRNTEKKEDFLDKSKSPGPT